MAVSHDAPFNPLRFFRAASGLGSANAWSASLSYFSLYGKQFAGKISGNRTLSGVHNLEDTTVTTKAASRLLLLIGIAGVIVLMLTGAVTTGGLIVSQMLDGGVVTLRDRVPALIRMLVIGGYISIWLFVPYWAAFMQQRSLTPGRNEGTLALVTVIMLVVPATYAYMSELVVMPELIASKTRRDSAILLFVVPLYQWSIIVIGSAARRFFSSRQAGARV